MCSNMTAHLKELWQEFTLRFQISDRRVAPRRAFAASIEITTDAGEQLRGAARDLSATGMGAIVYGTLNEGTSIRIRYEHPRLDGKPQPIVRQAIVRRRYG